MAVTVEDFRIDIAKVQSFKYLQAKQFDHNSRRRRLIITDSNIPIKYSDTRSEYITLSLSINGDNYSNTSCPFESDGYPYITFTESMLSKVGDIDCEIRIYDPISGTIVTTFSFMMTISKSLLSHDRLVASSEFDILNDLILQASNIPSMLEEFKESKETILNLITQINNDISLYQENYQNLSSEAKKLISDVKDYLDDIKQAETDRVSAENDRINAEQKRQQDTANAISNAEAATNNAINATKNVNDVIVDSQNATIKAIQSATDANEAKEQCLAAIENLKHEMRILDGGGAATLESNYDDEYDGGGA